MKIGIFTSFQGDKVVNNAKKACESIGVDYEVVDITSEDWIHNVMQSDADGFFCPSTTKSQELKTIQDERYYFVSQVMNRPIYPDFTGLYIHESKRNMAAWLEINDYPHAKTRTFTNRQNALEYLESCSFPIVSKANVGAAASKVKIIKNKRQAVKLINSSLSTSRFSFCNPGIAYKMNIGRLLPRVKDYRNGQKNYFIIQDFVPNVIHEWRILKIGDSYFGHQKLMKGNFASGSGLVGWVAPPLELLEMVRDICEKGGFLCMDVDIFETKEGNFVVNELQASFGSYADYQLCVDGHHGRYIYKNKEFIFEEGDFNVFGSTKIKIEHFIDILSRDR